MFTIIDTLQSQLKKAEIKDTGLKMENSTETD